MGLALASTAPVDVAVTIDDLPFAGEVGPHDTKEAATDRILSALRGHQAPVNGFVNCGKAESKESLHALLKRWIAAGAELGNHTASHKSVDQPDFEAWLNDVRACDRELVQLLGKPVTLFRYPFLQEGRTPERRDAAGAALAKMGYRIGQVSIDTSDWVLAEPYVRALAQGDRAESERMGQAYVRHMLGAARHYREEARLQTGRDLKHVLLLHANALNADWLGAVLDALAKDGFRFIKLDEALKDPIYRQPEQYVGPIGISWLYRVGPGAQARDRWRWDDAQADYLSLAFGRKTMRITDALTIRSVAPDTYVVVHQGPPRPANSVVAEMPDGTLLFAGSPYLPAATRSVIDWIKERFPGRKLVAVDTHFHVDGGPGGHVAYREAGAKVYGSDLTAKLIREHGEQHGFTPEPPGEVFPLAKGLTLTFDAEEVQVRFPGAAHAPDNVVIWFPARGILFGGCAVVAMPKMGYLGDADLTRWPAALEAMRQLRPRLVIPGHDEPGDVTLLDHTLALVKEASSSTGAARAR
jgi:peptidoglycan/xylan/chitin deacetylase (PgdA/CDA1 family)/glyoxylase-like metal-dependent hydrolase (beta-lactamase superfamily II)